MKDRNKKTGKWRDESVETGAEAGAETGAETGRATSAQASKREPRRPWLARLDDALAALEDEQRSWKERAGLLAAIDETLALPMYERFLDSDMPDGRSAFLPFIARVLEAVRRPYRSRDPHEQRFRLSLARFARILCRAAGSPEQLIVAFPERQAIVVVQGREHRGRLSAPVGLSLYDFHVEVPFEGTGMPWQHVFVRDPLKEGALVPIRAQLLAERLLVTCPRCGQDVLGEPRPCAVPPTAAA